MRFRPCIDIHNGKVKQIVGGSLSDSHASATENFTASQDASYFADLYRKYSLSGGHIILLNPKGTPEYEADRAQAVKALSAWPGGMQIGGGMTPENAADFLDLGASHVIVTSYIFDGPALSPKKLNALCAAVGRDHLVIDLSCRKRDGKYYVVTDRWQTFTDLEVGSGILDELAGYCDEFLIHGVDSEGLGAGFEKDLIRILASHRRNRITYAGGIASVDHLRELEELSSGRLDFTVGSALDLFGGSLPFQEIAAFH